MICDFLKVCKMSQQDLKKYVKKVLKKTHEEVISGDGYVYAQGEFPVLLVAHLDTVHDKIPETIWYEKEKDAISSKEGIGGDDRCGVYMIFEIVKKWNCSVLFCEDEEIGGVGAKKFTKTDLAKGLSFNYIIEFDRKGSNDAVFYDCDNEEFEKFITKDFYKTAHGSFSDISTLAPFLKCAAVNLSCGYYNAHTKNEYVVMSEMERSIEEACKILARTTEEDKFEYVEAKFGSALDYLYERGFGYGYGNLERYYMLEYIDEEGREDWYDNYASTEEEFIGMFCIDHPNIPYSSVTSFYSEQDLM